MKPSQRILELAKQNDFQEPLNYRWQALMDYLDEQAEKEEKKYCVEPCLRCIAEANNEHIKPWYYTNFSTLSGNKKERWKLENDEKYWVVTTNGEVIRRTWNSDEEDEAVLEFGNIFRIKEEAIVARDKVKELLTKWHDPRRHMIIGDYPID